MVLEVFLGPELDAHRRLAVVLFLLSLGLRYGFRFAHRLLLGIRVLVVGQVVGEVGLAHARAAHRAFRGFSHRPVGDDAFGLDRAPGRRVIARGGQFHPGAIRQIDLGLHRALAEGCGTHHHRTLVVLQRAGDDFRGRGRAVVDQHHDRHVLDGRRQPAQRIFTAAKRVFLGRRGVVVLGIGQAPVGRDDQGTRLEKGGRDADRRMQQAARVVAHVQHQAGQLAVRLLVHALDGARQIIDRTLLELGQADVREAGLGEFGLDALDADHFADQGEFERTVFALACDRQLDRRLRLAAHSLDRIGQRNTLGRGVIDFHDQVARLDPGTGGRRVLDR